MVRQVFSAKRTDEDREGGGLREEPSVVPLNREPTGPQNVGELLRLTREHYGQTLPETADALKIRESYIVALEEGRVDALPGPTYAVGFVRTYAEHLGLDHDAVVERFKDETAALEDQTQLVFPSPMPEGRVPSGAILMIAALMAGVAYGGWLFLSSEDRQVSDLMPSLPDRLVEMVRPSEGVGEPPLAADLLARSEETTNPPVVSPSTLRGAATADGNGLAATTATSQAGEVDPSGAPLPTRPEPLEPPKLMEQAAASPSAATADGVQAGAQPQPEVTDRQSMTLPWESGGEGVVPSEPSSATASEAGVAASSAVPQQDGAGASAPTATPSAGQNELAAVGMPPAPPAPGVEGPRRFGADGDVRIVITATQDSWVEVRDADGRALLTRMLRAGDSYRVPDEPGISMLTGNAGGLDITVDGAPLAPLGPPGTVRRNVALDPDKLPSAAVGDR